MPDWKKRYNLTIRDNSLEISSTSLMDPFHSTTVYVQPSFRVLWLLLRKKLQYSIHLTADQSVVGALFEAHQHLEDGERKNTPPKPSQTKGTENDAN